MKARLARTVALIVPALLLVASVVLAAGPRVVILGPAPEHPVVARARDELSILGFDVRVEVAQGAADLPAVAHRLGASAVARVTPASIELWVDPAAAAGAPPVETLRGGGDPAVLALRAVELIRARLLPVPVIESIDPAPPAKTSAPAPSVSSQATAPAASAQQPAEAAPPPAAPSAPPAPPADRAAASVAPRGRFAIHAAPAFLLSPGGVPAAFHVRAGAEWALLPRLGLEAIGYLPVTAGAAAAGEGSVDVRAFDLGAGLRGLVTAPASDLGVAFGLGLSAMILIFRGHGTAGWMSQSGTRAAFAPYAGATFAYRFHPRLSLRLDVVAAVVRPEPVVRVVGREIASFGQPAVFPSLGLEVRP